MKCRMICDTDSQPYWLNIDTVQQNINDVIADLETEITDTFSTMEYDPSTNEQAKRLTGLDLVALGYLFQFLEEKVLNCLSLC